MDYHKGFDPPSALPSQRILTRSDDRKSTGLKVVYDKPRHHAQQVGDLSAAQVRADLQEMGYDEARIKELMAIKEPPVDGFAQLNPAEDFQSKNASKQESLYGQKTIDTIAVRSSYSHLVVYPTEPNWVLFDANLPLSVYKKKTMSDLFAKYKRYEPGNIRIVKYNLRSESFGLQSTPGHFQAHRVDYTENGPKLVPLSHGANDKTSRSSGRSRKPTRPYSDEHTGDTTEEEEPDQGKCDRLDGGAHNDTTTKDDGQPRERAADDDVQPEEAIVKRARLLPRSRDQALPSIESAPPKKQLRSSASLAPSPKKSAFPTELNDRREEEYATKRQTRSQKQPETDEDGIPMAWALLDKKPKDAPDRWRPLEEEIVVASS